MVRSIDPRLAHRNDMLARSPAIGGAPAEDIAPDSPARLQSIETHAAGRNARAPGMQEASRSQR
ncbi:hypothetical protein DR62_07860 [Burkholderia thailandensis]|uniref:Uncharacterized protein n=1 Tax=Burkholderia thailandensis TaxID=57975 RepID=A0AAW9CLF1_BURTH|nr:hypothetical protein DR62_07860 [Burkholderia thailandensis]AOI55625.1 hypothetical protein WI24_28325 [Burkholderia thailandensis]AOJ54585.1 hypothetical protein AQ475_28110 [Burkholderia thailandensis]AVR27246.1 hypothetical protein A8H32_19300 [Burkholderia thailandensis]MDD1483037.1 hypothetical protein [Burkholderia thailandensis]